MRNKRKRLGMGMAVLFASMLMMLPGCGTVKEERSAEGLTENFSDGSAESTPEITLPVVTPLNWETPVMELGEETFLSMEVKDYVSVTDDRYDEYALESTVDLLSPGEYEIRISGYGEVYAFPVIVQDTVCPEMELLCSRDVVAPGSTISADAVFASASDNDPEFVQGFYGLKNITEEEWSAPETEELSYEKQKNAGMALDEIAKSITLPEEEGFYFVNAAVLDRSGNLVMCPVYFAVDGTGPQIGLRKKKVTLYTDQSYDFKKGVTLADNFFSEEDCSYRIDEEELNAFQSSLQSGKTGTYQVTYYAEDPLGNTSSEVLTIILAERPAPQENSAPQGNDGTPQGNNNTPQNNHNGSQGNDGNQNMQPAPAGASYDLEMAQAAFAAVNAYRTGNGIAALTWNDTLYENCKVRGTEIETSFAHVRPDGQNFFTAVTVSYVTAGENIAAGYVTAQSVADAWWNSAGHKANMLNESFTQGAIVCYYSNGTYYWVNLFTG